MLKNISLILLFIFISMHVQAQNSDLQLTTTEETEILNNLNNICGDTWCEGEFELNFTSIEFLSNPNNHYKINFTASQYINDHETRTVPYYCDIQDIFLVQKLVKERNQIETEQNNIAFYNLINECINEKL